MFKKQNIVQRYQAMDGFGYTLAMLLHQMDPAVCAALLEVESESVLLKFTVTDRGTVGITAGKLVIIFNSFSQSDQSTSRRYGGFGLVICKKLKT